MKNKNLYLMAGLMIILFFGAMMTFPSLFTQKSPYAITGVESIENDDGTYRFQTPPFEPSEKFVIGSDDSGRDVFSFVVYGARLTLTIGITVAVLRFIMGLIFGIASSLDNGFSTVLVDQFNNVFNAIPPLIICLIILSIGFLGNLPKTYSILVFIIVMTIVEWARVAALVRERSLAILKKEFIRSERVIGKSDMRIIVENLLPHMFSELVVLFFMEISRVLTLMMQLGLFGIFVGNLKIVEDTAAGIVIGKKTSYEPEWASMLGSSKNYVRVAPWIVFSCSLAFFLSVLGLNFTGEGFRNLYQEGKTFFKTKKHQWISLVMTVTIVVLGCAMTYEPSVASTHDAYSFLDEIPSVCLIGTEEATRVAESIKEEFTVLGLGKTKGQYVFPYEVSAYYHVTDFDVTVEENSESLKDWVGLLSYGSFDGQGRTLDLRQEALMAMDFDDVNFKNKVKNHFLMINGDIIDQEGWLFFSKKLIDQTECLGVIIPVDQVTHKMVGITNYKKPIITLNKEKCHLLADGEIKLAIKSCKIQGLGRNIVGQIIAPNSTDETKGVILGFAYNYLDPSIGKKQLSFAMDFISTLKTHQDRLKRNVTVVFWDGTYDDALSGLNSYRNEYYYPIKHSLVYIDMKGLYRLGDRDKPLVIGNQYVTLTQPDAYSLSKYLEGSLDSISVLDNKVVDPYSVFYHKRGIQTLYMGSDSDTLGKVEEEKLQNTLVEALLKEIY